MSSEIQVPINLMLFIKASAAKKKGESRKLDLI